VEVQNALRENAERAAEAISVEEASISLLEQQEATTGPSDGLALSPFTWSLMEGMPDDGWSGEVPAYLVDSEVTVPVAETS
jgi:hypothetical protein